LADTGPGEFLEVADQLVETAELPPLAAPFDDDSPIGAGAAERERQLFFGRRVHIAPHRIGWRRR
jgi:hypothetical protein